MKLGLGLKPHQWDDEHLAFARQLGCRSIVAWMPLPQGDGVWHVEDLTRLRRQVERHGLELGAVENLHPAHWDHVVLGERGRDEQTANVCQTIRNVGAAGIPVLGYSFSVVGVWGYYSDGDNRDGRGGAGIKRFDIEKLPTDDPPDNQRFWFNTTLPQRSPNGTIPPVEEDEMWRRLECFLTKAVPVAEEAGVRLAAHPDDPPVPTLRRMYRPLTCVENLQRLIDLVPSRSNCLEFCQGTVAAMPQTDVIAAIRRFASQDRIAYVHFRNVSRMLPCYDEVFIDEGRIDMMEALRAYRDGGFEGTLIPDHTPRVSCAAPWEAGMSYALGFMKAAMRAANVDAPDTPRGD